jgi:hypothetical protein
MLYFALALLLLAVILGFVMGLKYLFSTSFTPYHAQVVGKPWEQLEPRVQAIIVGMLRVIGAAFSDSPRRWHGLPMRCSRAHAGHLGRLRQLH